MKSCVPLILSVLLPAQALAASVQISVQPPSSQVLLIGGADTVLVDLVGKYEGDGNLIGGAVNLSFDPEVLEVLSVELTAPDDVDGLAGTIDNAAGTVNGIAFASFVGVPAGSFSLATLQIRGIGVGTSLLSVSDANDPLFEWYNDVPPLGEAVDFIGLPGSFSVALPLPAAWGMLLSALGVLGLWRMRRDPARPAGAPG
jgi:hypothetical protein